MAARSSATRISLTQLLLALVFVLLALIVLAQANPGTRLPGRDYGFYAYIGDQILHGKLPYRDAWESKPPAIFYLNALALWIGRGSRWGIWIVEYICLVLSIGISYSTLRRLWGTWAALGGTLLWLIGLSLTLEGGNLTEEYPLVLHFLSIALFLQLAKTPERRLTSLLLGLAFGISFLFRPNNAVIEAAVILTLLILRIIQRDIRNIVQQVIWIGIGALAPVVLTGLYFWSQGLLPDLLDASILYNLTYSSTAISSTPPLTTGFRIFGAAAWAALAGYAVAAFRASRKDTFFPVYLLALIGWPMVIFMSDPAKRNYAHYFINWLPFLGILGGLAIHFLTVRIPAAIQDGPAWQSVSVGAILLLCTGTFLFGGPAAEYQKALERFARRDSIGLDVRTRTAAYVENHTKPGEIVLFWAASPGENFMSKRESPSAYLFYPLYIPSKISARMNEQFLQDVITRQPVLIVDIGDHEALSLNPEERARQIAEGFAWEYPPDSLEAFFKFVEEHYQYQARVGDKAIYRIRPR